MKAEARFLLALASGGDPGAAEKRFDWILLEDLARRHEIDASCGWLVEQRSAGTALLPRGVRLSFRRAYAQHLMRNERLWGRLKAIAIALASNEVPFLVLKGPWLIHEAYPNPGMRPVGDIDLLVRESSYKSAVEVLAACGLRAPAGLPAHGQAALHRAQFGGQLRLVAPSGPPVEVHFRLVNSGVPATDEDWVWRTARSLACPAGILRVPGPEAMLLHLSLHANQHGFAILRLLHDIRWALRRDGPAISPSLLVEIANDRGLASITYHALALAHELAAAPLPAWHSRLRPGKMRSATYSSVWRLRKVRRLEKQRGRVELEAPSLALLELGSPSEKVRYLGAVIGEAGGAGPFIRRLKSLVRGRVHGTAEKSTARLTTAVEARPRARKDLVRRQIDDDALIYDVLDDRTILLNRSALAVLDLCDGARTVDAIVKGVRRAFPASGDDLDDSVRTTLEQIRDLGLIEISRVSHREM